MQLGWKTILPLALGFFVFSSSILVGFNILPDHSSSFYTDSTNVYRLVIDPSKAIN
jgi:hypothetical protein